MKKALIAVGIMLLLAAGAGEVKGADIGLHLVSQTSTTITLGWTPQPGYGYIFSADGAVVSRTNNASTSTVKFSKGSSSYEVSVLEKGDTQTYSPAPPPPPPPAGPPAPANLRVTSSTQTSIGIAWDASAGATNYHIYRGSTLLGQGPGSSGGYQNAWADSGLTCGTSYGYSVDAQNSDGTSSKATITTTTAPCDPPTETQPPPPPPGGGQTISASQFQAMATNGATIDGYTVKGSVSINNPNVTVKNAVIQGVITFNSGANGGKILNSSATGFNVYGADGVVIDGNTFDGGNNRGRNYIQDSYPQSSASPVMGVTVSNNTIQNYCCDGAHEEAIYIGGDVRNGYIAGNRFPHNTTAANGTAHLFFSWCGRAQGDQIGCASPSLGTYPLNWCVTGNTFGDGPAYYAIQARPEIPSSNQIRIVSSQPTLTPAGLLGPDYSNWMLVSSCSKPAGAP